MRMQVSESQKNLLLISAFSIILALAMISSWADGAPVVEKKPAKQNRNNYNDLVDELISDLLTDSDRWKKSRLYNNGIPIKQTLRFGRSDPLFKNLKFEEEIGEQPVYADDN